MASVRPIKVDLTDLKELTAQFPEASAAARRNRLQEALLLLEREVKRLTPEGAGPIHLRDTVFQKLMDRGDSIWGIVATPAAYGEPLEFGSRPHFPPIAPIRFWVEKKLRLSGAEAKSAAFCIARAISRRGTKGAKMFGTGFESNESAVVAILNRIPDDIVKAVGA